MNKIMSLTLLFLVLLTFASSAMELAEPKGVYNLGEKIYISLSGIKGGVEGSLKVDLRCKNDTINLLNIPSSAFSPDTPQLYSLPFKILNQKDLEFSNLTKIVGNCNIVASLSGESIKSKTFEITDKVNLKSSLNKLTYTPGEVILLDIYSTTANGENFTGKYEISNFTDENGELIFGRANVEIKTDESQKSGTYILSVMVYNQDSEGNVLNYNTELEYFVISQKPTKIDLSVSDLELNPNQKLTINPILLDQAGEKIDEDIVIYLESPSGDLRVFNINSDDYYDVEFESNDSMGKWNIYAFFGNTISDKYEIDMNCLPKLQYEIIGGLLEIKNIGNCLYDKQLNITIADKSYSFQLSLPKSSTKQFNLQAPDGDYSISINSEDNEEYSGNTFLTGNAISVKSIGDGAIKFNLNKLLTFIFLAIVVVGFYFVNKNLKKIKDKPSKETGSNFLKKIKSNINFLKLRNKKHNVSKEEGFKSQDKNVTAESTLVLNGEKMNSSIVTLLIKNYKDLPDDVKNILIEMIKNLSPKLTIDIKDEYYFMILNPLITKTYKNDMTAIQMAFKLNRELTNYNRKYKFKLDYGISVHTGDIIARKEKGILKYTGVGDIFILSKKMASLSSSKILISDVVRKKLIRDLRVIKENRINNQDIYSVSEIRDIELNKSKLDDILKRINN